MARSSVKDAAFQDLDLLRQVVAFKDRFYPAGSAHYELADEHMKNMIFGEKPEFEVILAAIAALESEIHSLA